MVSWSPVAVPIVDMINQMHMWWHLNGFYLDGRLPESDGKTTVILGQHVSLYDGFVVREAHKQAYGRDRLVTIMLNSQLRNYPFYRVAGAFGITPGTVESGRQLRALVREELTGSDSVAFFPQGRIETMDADPTRIGDGYRVFNECTAGVRFVPLAIALEPLNHAKPTLFARIGPVVGFDQAESAFAETVTGLRSWLAARGESAAAEWPGLRVL